MRKNKFLIALFILTLSICLIACGKNEENTNESNSNVTNEVSNVITDEEVISNITETAEEESSIVSSEEEIDEEKNGEYTGQDVNFASEETLDELHDMEIVDENSQVVDTNPSTDLSDEEKVALIDTNSDGILTKDELTAYGIDTYMIQKGMYLYNYMNDPDNDGIIWEDEME